MYEATTESKGSGGTEERTPCALPVRDADIDWRMLLWLRAMVRIPGACRKFKRLDRRARRGLWRIGAGLARAMVHSSVWGRPGGREAINEAMRVTQRTRQRHRAPREHRALSSWFMAFGVAFNDGGRIAQRFIDDPRRAAASEWRSTSERAARPKVVARILRILPASMRSKGQWPFLPFLVKELGAAETTLLIRRDLAAGVDVADIELTLTHAWRRHGVRARYGAGLSEAQVDAIIVREFSPRGAA